MRYRQGVHLCIANACPAARLAHAGVARQQIL